MKKFLRYIIPEFILTKWKEKHEIKYWQNRIKVEGKLSNDHYKEFYTKHFNIDLSFYKNKRILDIGCGPRGSLEWADIALERIGLDPLSDKYLNLGTAQHKMKYITAPSEAVPFDNDYFDIVTSFNSIDHVENLNNSISEIKRVLKPGGLFLLLTELNHDPTVCEPQNIQWDIVQKFLPDLEILEEKHYEKKLDGIYGSIRQEIFYDHSDRSKRYGILSVKFRKTGLKR